MDIKALFDSPETSYPIGVNDSCKQISGSEASAETKAAWWKSPGTLLAAGALLVVLGIAAESVVALAIVLMDGAVAGVVIVSAALAGGWIIKILGLGTEPWTDRLVIGSGLGIGILSLIVLGLGSLGWLTRAVAFGLVVVLAVLGLARLFYDSREAGRFHPHGTKTTNGRIRFQWFHGLWLALCPFLVIALLSACLPPGVLWHEEGNGYDVLEYHLAVPKTFFTEGHIAFLPYNVYSNFPLASEMLSLLMMTLRGDAIEAAYMATMVNVILAGLFVAAAWLAGRTISPLAGVLAGVLAGTLPWITYLAGIAYVEAGMLAMSMCCLAAITRAQRADQKSRGWLIAAGMLAGLACGFKYSAGPLVALPTAGLILLVRANWPERMKHLLVFGIAATVTFSPWMIRNAINTHNPLFPLGYSCLGAKAGTWDDVLEARWQHAHYSIGIGQTDTPIGLLALKRTIGDFRMGFMLFIFAAIGALRNKDRWTIGLAAMLVWQMVFWIAATHLFARFAVVMVLPLIVLATRMIENMRSTIFTRVICVIVIMSGVWNIYGIGDLYFRHTRVHDEKIEAYGRTDWFEKGQWPWMQHLAIINSLGDNARVMMVGDARSFYVRPECRYAVVFNHHPLADAVNRLKDERSIVEWLRQQNITHVFVHWFEMDRLRKTYGFYPQLDRNLFERLASAGLAETDKWSYATLYEVRPDE